MVIKMLNVDNKIKSKQYYKAYLDYGTGNYTYEQLAKKYKVSTTTINTWRSRYWSKWDSQSDSHISQSADSFSQSSQCGSQQPTINIGNARNREVFAPIVAKQINDTNPARIYQEYSRDNLPQLEPKQARFVEEYLIDLCKTDAAIRAGYSVASAPDIGCHLYDNPAVFAHIQVALAERRKRTGVNVDTTIREMARIAYANPARVIANDGSIIEGASEDDLAAIASIKIKTTPTKTGKPIVEREVRFHDKNKALEMLGKQQGMFIDKQLVLTANAGDLSKLSTAELEAELQRQQQLANTINITPVNCTHGMDNDE